MNIKNGIELICFMAEIFREAQSSGAKNLQNHFYSTSVLSTHSNNSALAKFSGKNEPTDQARTCGA
jgi:hypothetical protein